MSAVFFMVGIMALVMATLVSLVAGFWVHLAIIGTVLGFTVGTYLWFWRHDPGYALRRFTDLMR